MKKGLLFALLFVMVISMGSVAAKLPDEIRIGVLYALTGEGSDIGQSQRRGIELAVKEVNDLGGLEINGKKIPVRAIVRDTETQPDVAVRRYREFISEGINIIVGGTFGHVSTALNAQAQNGRAFVMATNGLEERIFEADTRAPYFLSSQGATDAIGRMCADYVAQTYNPNYVIMLLPDYSYGHGAHTGAMTVFNSKYPEIKVETIWTPVGTPDYTSYIISIKEKKPDVVMMGQWGSDCIQVIKQAYELGLTKEINVFYNSINAALALGIPPEAIEGLRLGLWLYHDLSGIEDRDPETVKAMRQLSERWMAEYNEQPDVMSVYAYIGMKETLRAIELAGSTNPKDMWEALMNEPEFMSVKGPARWRPDGRPFYKYGKLMGVGLGEADRETKFDYAKVIDVYEGEYLVKPLEEMGY